MQRVHQGVHQHGADAVGLEFHCAPQLGGFQRLIGPRDTAGHLVIDPGEAFLHRHAVEQVDGPFD